MEKKICEVCKTTFGKKGRESWAQFAVKLCCSTKCSGIRARLKKGCALPSVCTSRAEAKQLVPAGPCSKCGREGKTHVHHKDRNPLNNALENLVRLCPPCHGAEHRIVKQKCYVCEKREAKSHGYCNACYKKSRRETGVTQELYKRKTRRCSLEGCDLPHYAKGFCNKHWQTWDRERKGIPTRGFQFK